ncbi:MAG: hypothetical protein ACFCU5_01600 [Pleurocapsa sp.]
MGEAKRRKQLDPGYGATHFLATPAERDKHIKKIIHELFSQFKSELTELITAETIPDNYEEIQEKLAAWLSQRLSDYRSGDRAAIANALILYCGELSAEYDCSPVLFMCFVDMTNSHLPAEERQKIAQILENLAAKLPEELRLTTSASS